MGSIGIKLKKKRNRKRNQNALRFFSFVVFFIFFLNLFRFYCLFLLFFLKFVSDGEVSDVHFGTSRRRRRPRRVFISGLASVPRSVSRKRKLETNNDDDLFFFFLHHDVIITIIMVLLYGYLLITHFSILGSLELRFSFFLFPET